MKNTLEYWTTTDETGLSPLLRGLLTLLDNSGLERVETNIIMILIKEDIPAQLDLLLYLHDNHPTAREIMSTWLAGYLQLDLEQTQDGIKTMAQE